MAQLRVCFKPNRKTLLCRITSFEKRKKRKNMPSLHSAHLKYIVLVLYVIRLIEHRWLGSGTTLKFSYWLNFFILRAGTAPLWLLTSVHLNLFAIERGYYGWLQKYILTSSMHMFGMDTYITSTHLCYALSATYLEETLYIVHAVLKTPFQ